jgi:formate dehydrogenase beta subunit
MGLFGRPTLNHNVEALWWIRDIIEKGPEAFAAQGKPGHPDLRSWSVSGRVANPGVSSRRLALRYENSSTTIAVGWRQAMCLRRICPAGVRWNSTGFDGGCTLDFGGELAKAGAFVGSHAVVVFSDHDNMKAATLNLLEFFHDESCGQCRPCRECTRCSRHRRHGRSRDPQSRVYDARCVDLRARPGGSESGQSSSYVVTTGPPRWRKRSHSRSTEKR